MDAFENYKRGLSRNLKAAREAAGMTQEQLSLKSGQPAEHIARIERAEHSPSNKTVTALAAALGATTEAIYPRELL